MLMIRGILSASLSVALAGCTASQGEAPDITALIRGEGPPPPDTSASQARARFRAGSGGTPDARARIHAEQPDQSCRSARLGGSPYSVLLEYWSVT